MNEEQIAALKEIEREQLRQQVTSENLRKRILRQLAKDNGSNKME